MAQYGKTVELFLVNGTAESLVTAELMNWNGKAFKVPRTEFFSVKRPEFSAAGVYFLLGRDNDGEETVYIGEAENVRERIKIHVQTDREERNLWTTVVFVTGNDLDKTKLRYLENRFVDITKKCGRYHVLTKSTYTNTIIKEAQKAAMEEFIENARLILSVLGYRLLEPLYEAPAPSSEPSSRENVFYLSTGESSASGMRTPDGFVVFKGAKIRAHSTPSTPSYTVKAREQAVVSGKVADSELVEDMLFSSPSAASSFVTGSSSNGLDAWKAPDGRTLKEVESEETQKD